MSNRQCVLTTPIPALACPCTAELGLHSIHSYGSLQPWLTGTCYCYPRAIARDPGEISGLLLKSGKSWDGGSFHFPAGEPEISILRIRLEDAEETPFHCHPVPTFGYLMQGTLEVKTAKGDTTLIREGQAAIEVMRTLHRGKAIGGPVEILVFYAGAVNRENTLPEGDSGCS